MRDQNHLSVFTPAFLQRLDNRDRSGWTCAEAEYAGPWRVAERDGLHCLIHASQRKGGPAVAEFLERETALLVAAVFPLLGRASPYGMSDTERHGGHGADLNAILDARVEWIGWCRLLHQELPDALHIAERFLRSPEALANLLEAASHEVVDRAGAILAERLSTGRVEGGASHR